MGLAAIGHEVYPGPFDRQSVLFVRGVQGCAVS